MRVRKTLSGRTVPLLSIFAAFAFVIMMFNVPVPGGTTAHAVGGTLAAIVLGPWAAVITTSVALIIQALFFGDGGITAIGANCFNMAIVLPIVGYVTYRLSPAARAALAAPRRRGRRRGYVGITRRGAARRHRAGHPADALVVDGVPDYSPYNLAPPSPRCCSRTRSARRSWRRPSRRWRSRTCSARIPEILPRRERVPRAPCAPAGSAWRPARLLTAFAFAASSSRG